MKKSHWLDLAEYASLIGLGVGSVATVVSSQLLYTSAPLSMLALLNLANRKRHDEQTEQQTTLALNQIDQKVTKHIELLDQQVQSLPTPEILGSLRRSLLVKNREMVTQLSDEIAALQTYVQRQVSTIEKYQLGDLREDMDLLQEQQTELVNRLEILMTRQTQASNPERVVDLERAITQLRNDAGQLRSQLQKLADQTRPALSSLQDQITHLNRQYQKLPPPFDPAALKQEVEELIRVVADLVPRRDWQSLVNEVQGLHQQQESLTDAREFFQRQLQELQQQLQNRPSRAQLVGLQGEMSDLQRQVQELPPAFDPTMLRWELVKLVKTVNNLVPQQDFAGLAAQVQALQEQQAYQSQLETVLRQQIQVLQTHMETMLMHQSDDLPTADLSVSFAQRPTAQSGVQQHLQTLVGQELRQVQERLQGLLIDPGNQEQMELILHQEFDRVNRQILQKNLEDTYTFLLDPMEPEDSITMPLTAPAEFDELSSHIALHEALASAQNHLMLVLPWFGEGQVEPAILERLEQFLQAGGRLDLGWCHRHESDRSRLLKPISQQWLAETPYQTALQNTLQTLLQFKRSYPNSFHFKILAVRESFVVVDAATAIVGLEDVLPQTQLFSGVGLRLRTTDLTVIEPLIQTFHQPAAKTEDPVACWHRAVTHYELSDRTAAIADVERVLVANPEDAMAYNLRGVLRYDEGDRDSAIADFTQAIQLRPRLVAAYCNRGYLQAEQGDYLAAIADFNDAIRLRPDLSLAYFYRGMACQKFGELDVAIANFDEALFYSPQAAHVYYYRGLARPKLGDYRGAISDLERAIVLFTQRGNSVNAQRAQAHLESLRRAFAVITSNAEVRAVTREDTAPDEKYVLLDQAS